MFVIQSITQIDLDLSFALNEVALSRRTRPPSCFKRDLIPDVQSAHPFPVRQVLELDRALVNRSGLNPRTVR